MGRGNDHRDRRRGRDDQPGDPWGGGEYTPPPSSFDRPRPRTGGFGGAPGGGTPAGGPETEAKVKWFNGEKGFGFVELTDGSGEAFLHIRPVEAAGYSALESGTTLVVRVGPGQRGPQVTEVVSVDTSTADPSAGRGGAGGAGGFGARRPTGGPGGAGGFRDRGDRGGGFAPRPSFESAPAGPPDTSGTVKWYDPVKGFGFISVEGEAKDLFIHRSVLERAGMRDLAEGERVRVAIVEGRKGREVGAIEAA